MLDVEVLSGIETRLTQLREEATHLYIKYGEAVYRWGQGHIDAAALRDKLDKVAAQENDHRTARAVILALLGRAT